MSYIVCHAVVVLPAAGTDKVIENVNGPCQKYVEKCLIDGDREGARDPNGLAVDELRSNKELMRTQ